ncbi:MAG: cytochrome c class [Acidimicrobiales bacterium]|nr:cytochrome c class [Acidimicrobiales bacterium]
MNHADQPERRHRRHRRLALVSVLGGVVGLTFLVVGRAPAGADSDLEAHGRSLYLEGCVSCHGTKGQGVGGSGGDNERGPRITDAGAAGAYYMLSTGRMPLNDPNEQPHRKDPAYGPKDIDALVAFVASLGHGPALTKVDLADASLANGGLVFRADCQACHSASGSGGALSYGRAAPSLREATPEQVAAAVRSGPGQMPVFGQGDVDRKQLRDLVAYVQYLRHPSDRGGLAIGRVGPVPEGFVAWSVGVVLLLACVFWIGTRSPIRSRPGANADADADADADAHTNADSDADVGSEP